MFSARNQEKEFPQNTRARGARARSPREAGDVQENARKTRTRNKTEGKERDATGMDDE